MHPEGSEFLFHWEDDEWIKIKTPLLGKANIENLTAAIIVAKELGVDKEAIVRASASMPQVEHRLQTINTAIGYTIIDDAYNSNPVGAKMAVEVLGQITTGGRKFIITPGMIELGEKQVEKNVAFGKQIGEAVDVAIIVGHYNREALLDGLKTAGMPTDNVYVAATFLEAQKIMLSMIQRGDVVLLENDLPDTFK